VTETTYRIERKCPLCAGTGEDSRRAYIRDVAVAVVVEACPGCVNGWIIVDDLRIVVENTAEFRLTPDMTG
jgi:hypothetical protein